MGLGHLAAACLVGGGAERDGAPVEHEHRRGRVRRASELVRAYPHGGGRPVVAVGHDRGGERIALRAARERREVGEGARLEQREEAHLAHRLDLHLGRVKVRVRVRV